MKKYQEFVLQGEEIFIGLEDSKTTWRLAIRHGNMIVAETSMEARYEVLSHYLAGKFPNCRIHIGYEAGFRGFWLRDLLEAAGHDCIVIPPNRVHQEKSNTQKNDTKDSRLLAEMVQYYPHKRCHIPTVEARSDREVLRLYGSIQEQITAVKNRIRKKLVFHGFERHFPGKSSWKDSDYAKIKSVLSTIDLSITLSFSFENHLDQLSQLQNRKKMVLHKLMELSENAQYVNHVKILKSVPGIGPIVSIGIILELAGDVRRFVHRKQWGSFLGFAPCDFSSGAHEHKGHISGEGNKRMRTWFIEAAWIAIKRDPIMLKKYNDVKCHSGSAKKAIVAVAHKLALRCRSLLISGESYQIGVIEG